MRHGGALNDEDKFEWVRGPPSGSPLPPLVTEFINTVAYPHYFSVLETEEDKTVVERVLENLREMNEDLGPAAFQE